MLTKCPSCGTTFRVSPTQLKVRAGTVRCGQCQHVFNALETLADDPVSHIADSASTATPEAIDELPEEKLPRIEAEIEASETSSGAAEIQEEIVPDRNDEAPAPDAASPSEDYLDHAEAEPSAPPARRWPWLLGSFLALCGLLLQATYYYRVELAVLRPDLRPLLQAVCKPLNCEVPRPRHIDTLGIDTSDLHPDPEQTGHLTLTATLRSKAVFAQEWPRLELTLTDVADNKLAVKHFTASDYLPRNMNNSGVIAAGFPANGEISISLPLDVGDLPAAGYRLYIFYP